MGATGFITSLAMSRIVQRFNTKSLLVVGMLICAVAPVSSACIKDQDKDFWKHAFSTTVLGVFGVTIVYCTITVVLLESVPNGDKSLRGGMIDTAFVCRESDHLFPSRYISKDVNSKSAVVWDWLLQVLLYKLSRQARVTA